MRAGIRNRKVEIQQRETTQDPDTGTTIVTGWNTVATVFAEVQELLPSRSESIAEGINIARRPARVRMLYRGSLDSGMRLLVAGRDKPLRIVAGPAELGFHEGVELMAEEMSTSGDEP